jgi:hypothetical protein
VKSRPASVVLSLALAALGAACATPESSGGSATAQPATTTTTTTVTTTTQAAPAAQPAAEPESRSAGHVILLYLPNRIFDVLDIVRARVKVGPGIGFTVRATELADVKLGAWTSAWIGLRGPRMEPRIPWPVGLETYAGAGVSVLEAESDELLYGHGEVGLGVHVALVGVDVGVDLLEIGDLVLGLVTIDIGDDDY